jgi:hypothetical protein
MDSFNGAPAAGYDTGMSGIAPLSGPITATAPTGVALAAPGSVAPAPPPPTPAQAPSFTAFPSSYAGFGTNGSNFGTLGVVNGKLSIISTPSGGLPPANGTLSSTGNEAPANKPPSASTATSPAAVTASTLAADQTSTTTATGKNASPETTQANAPQQHPTASGVPTKGLVASSEEAQTPGGTAPPANLAQGLLGSPPTNPIVIQAEAQEAAAAEATRQADNEQAAQQAADQVQLQQLDQRIAAARASDDPAAVAQLQPDVSKIEGQLQGQTFAGVGSTPPLPVATPEIPTVFLNVAA